MSRLMKILGILIALLSFSLFETTSLLDMSFIEFLKRTSTIVSDAVDELVTPSERVANYQRQPSQPANRSVVNTRSSQPSGIIECPPEFKYESSSALIYESPLPSITDEDFIIEYPDELPLPPLPSEGFIIGYPDEIGLPLVPVPPPVGTFIVEPIPTPAYCYDYGYYYH